MKTYATELDERELYTSTDRLRLVDIIDALKLDGLTQHAPKIAEFLRHEDGTLRETAVETLVGTWGLPEYIPAAIEMLSSDPEWLVRSLAAKALASYVAWKKHPKIDHAMAALARATDDPNDALAKRIYKSLCFADAVLKGAEPLRIRIPEVERAQFDRKLVDKYR